MKTLGQPECRQEVLARLPKIGPGTPHLWGKMTAQQMICHVSDAFLGVMGDKPVQIPGGFSLWRLTKHFALYAPVKWPKGVPTRPEFDQQIGGTPPSQFERDMQTLRAVFDRFTAQPRGFQFQPHPLFGVLSEKDWMRWGYLHIDHHLRQFGA